MKAILKTFSFFLLALVAKQASAQLPTPAMVGYWENWNGNRFVNLKDIDDRYNVIQIAFANLKAGKDYDIEFVPPGSYNEQDFKAEMTALQAQGKKILISLGGQNDHVMLDTEQEKNTFISSVNTMIDYWGFDGFDIDLEGSSLNFDSINVQNPGDERMLFMIDAVKKIMENHHIKHGKKLLLTMAPETIYVQGALSPWAGNYRGAYLPIIEALRDSIDMLNVQLYNSGSMYGLDGQSGGEFKQGNADFVCAMTEAVILGYTATGTIGDYSGLDPSKVGVALPGCHSSDAVPHDELVHAMKYLMGQGPQPGNYTLKTAGGYPNIRGMMTWSINSDRKCDPSYGFVDTWSKLFTDSAYIEISNESLIYEQKEEGGLIAVSLFKNKFKSQLDTSRWSINNLPDGVVLDSLQRVNDSLVNIVLKGTATVPYKRSIFNIVVRVEGEEFQTANQDLKRTHGVVLRMNPSTIPGTVEAESYYDHKGVGTGTNWENTNEYRSNFGTGDWGRYEINVSDSGEYRLYITLATSPGNHSIAMSVDGKTLLSKTINSSNGYLNWQTEEFRVSLDTGYHDMIFQCKSGWMNVNHLEFELVPASVVKSVTSPVSLYPNPTTGVINSSIDLKNVSFMSLDGKTLKYWAQGTSFDLSQFSPGLYLIKSENYIGRIVLR